MTERSPSKLRSSRNIALEKGTVPAGFAEPELGGMLPVTNTDEAEAQPGEQLPPQTIASPFTNLKGGR